MVIPLIEIRAIKSNNCITFLAFFIFRPWNLKRIADHSPRQTHLRRAHCVDEANR